MERHSGPKIAQSGGLFTEKPSLFDRGLRTISVVRGRALKYRFFAEPASQAEGENAIYIYSNGFSGGFIGSPSKKPILERRGRGG